MTDKVELEVLSVLQGPRPRDKRSYCYYSVWRENQSEEVQKSFDAVMDMNSKWKATDIYNLAVKLGYELRYNTLRMHRAGECSCA